MTTTGDLTPRYRVVMNDEGQHSIWPSHRDIPQGWWDTGWAGSKTDCLTHVDEVWTDMRPRSVRGE